VRLTIVNEAMKFSLRRLFLCITAGAVLLWLNLRVSPDVTNAHLYSEPVGFREFFAMRGWPLSPWWFGSYGIDGLKKPLSFFEFYGVWLLNLAIAFALCFTVSYFVDLRFTKARAVN